MLVMHVDMDAFFAAIEQRDHAEYRGRPVIVGGLSGRGVVSTCSYEARRFGVHSAMAMERAKALCPQGIFVAGDYAHYRAVSRQIFSIFSRYSPVVEPLSVDEAFLDLAGLTHIMRAPKDYGARLKADILREVGLVASVGIAPNKFLAKIASDLEKPDGLVVIEPKDVLRVLAPLPVTRIWGVGKKTAQQLSLLRIRTIGELRAVPPPRLAERVGARMAAHLLALARGEDDRPVEAEREMKSIGREHTFPADIAPGEKAEQALLALAGEVGARLRRAEVRARTIQLKVRLGDFTTYTRSRTLPDATCYDEEIYREARALFRTLNVRQGIRLLGISAAGFTAGELSLFRDEAKKDSLYAAIDKINAKFGGAGITKAQLIEGRTRKPKR